MPETWYLKTLGALSLHPDSPEAEPVLSNSKSLAVLAYLARVPGREASREHVSRLLWPDMEPSRARRSLRHALYYLAQKADDRLVEAGEDPLRLVEGRLVVDVWRLDEALEREDWAAAVELYDGPFMEGYSAQASREFEGWAESQNERVWAGLKAGCYEAYREGMEQGRPEDAVAAARLCVDLNPLDERAQRALVEALLADGRRVEAYRQYESYRALLEEELGEAPGEELREEVEALEARLFDEPAAAGAGEATRAGREDRPVRDREAPTPEATSSSGFLSRALRWPAGLGVPRWAGAGAVLLLLLGVGLGRGWLPAPIFAGEDGAEASVAHVRARIEAPRGLGSSLLEIREERATVEEASVGPMDLPAPGGDRLARVLRTDGGTDLEVIEAESGRRTVLVDGPGDELAVDWSPDGRELLYTSGSDPGNGYRRTLHVLDVTSGVSRALPGPPAAGLWGAAAWSPRGARIALAGVPEDGGEADLYVVHADGRGLRRLTMDPGRDSEAAWSPDGRWIAFSSDREGSADLYLVRPDGSGLERLTYGPTHDRWPVWIGRARLVYLARSPRRPPGHGGEVRVLDVYTRRSWTVGEELSARRLSPHPAAGGRAEAAIERLEITAPVEPVSPGQRVELAVRAVTAAGDTLPGAALPLRWSVADPEVAEVAPEGGRLRVTSTGRTELRATAGGWRSDTVALVARPPEVRDVPRVLEEDWSGGIRGERWREVGTPRPAVEELEEGEGPRTALLNNGDANWGSGVVSREPVALPEEGLTLGFAARTPFGDSPWQSLRVELVGSAPEGEPESWPQRRTTRLGLLVGKSGDGPATVFLEAPPGGRHRLPSPGSWNGWHRYALQVEPDGRVSWVVDGRLRWRSPAPLLEPPRDGLHLYLGGRSVDARILLGPVRVGRGVRYGVR